MTIIAIDLASLRIATLDGRSDAPPVAPPSGGYATLTSLLYPIEVTESLDTSFAGVVGQLWDAVDALDVTTSLVSGVLTVTIAYPSITADPEGLDVTTSLVSGVLTVTIAYPSITADPEGLDVTTSLVSGVLVVVINYVTHTMDPEGLDVTTSLVSGVLA